MMASQEVRIATAIFPTLSILNHSCCPNTSLVFSTGATVEPSGSDLSGDRSSVSKGVTVTVRAANDVAAGQEILHCYGEPISHFSKHVSAECLPAVTLLPLGSGPHNKRMAVRERQRLLLDQYYFLCQCEACSLSKQRQQQQQGEEEEENGPAGKEQWSGLLCAKCKGPLKVGLHHRQWTHIWLMLLDLHGPF